MENEDLSTNYYPEETEFKQRVASLIEVLTNGNKMLNVLRHEFRGEELIQKENGENLWFQVSKPLFVRTVPGTEEPKKVKVPHPNKEGEIVEIFVPHDEAIEEIISLIKMCGVNQITPLGTTDQKEMNLDLYEFETRLSYLLTMKRKMWGIEKPLRPMIYQKLRQIVQDARTTQKDGRVLKALTQVTKRIESINSGERKSRTPYE